MERINYDDCSTDELVEMLSNDYKYNHLPIELRVVAGELLEIEFVSGEILKGFLNFCDDYEEWTETTHNINNDVNTFIKDKY